MRYLTTESTYILGVFPTGDTVTIDIHKLSDDSVVVNDGTCTEIATTGIFKYSFSQSVTTKTEYLWIMTNTSRTQQGKIILGGYPDDIQLLKKGNISLQFVAATSQGAIRKVDVGRLDAVIFKHKKDSDADWSSPVATQTLFAWYANLGDYNPSRMGEDG